MGSELVETKIYPRVRNAIRDAIEFARIQIQS